MADLFNKAPALSTVKGWAYLRTVSSNRAHHFRDDQDTSVCGKWAKTWAATKEWEDRGPISHVDCTACQHYLAREAACLQGIEDFEAGVARGGNRYKLSTREGKAWLYGWDEAKKVADGYQQALADQQ